MIIFECGPPFQTKPKLTPFCGGWHFIWLWFGFHYVPFSLNKFVESAIKLGREEGAASKCEETATTKSEPQHMNSEEDAISDGAIYATVSERLRIKEMEANDAEIARLRKDKAILIELVLDSVLTAGAKNLIAIAIRDGSLPLTPEVQAWYVGVVDRLK